MLQESLGEAVQSAYKTAIEQLDRQSAQAVLDMDKKLKREVAETVVEIIHRHTVSDKYKDEEVASNRVYPPTYRVRPVEAQVTELRKVFPSLGSCQEKLARRQLARGRRGVVCHSPLAGAGLHLQRSRGDGAGGAGDQAQVLQPHRRQAGRNVSAPDGALQAGGEDPRRTAGGQRHSGGGARRPACCIAAPRPGARAWPWPATSSASGVFAIGCMLLTHPERLSTGDTLMIDCGGDEYSVRGDYTFDRVPLFDFDMAGIEFSIFYEDRARNLWGTPTGFLYKLV